MKANEVIEEIRRIISRHRGDEKELLARLVDEAEGWNMRLDELEREAEDE